MTNEILNKIKDYAQKLLVAEYTYCGVADSPEFSMLNSDDGKGNDIKITIEVKDENL